jgi:GNAT superfamily N-acetyltransferase
MKELGRILKSKEVDYGFTYDLSKSFDIPNSKIDLQLRKLESADLETIFDFRKRNFSSLELKNALQCLLFAKSKIPTGYVGVTDKGIPCVMNWLILPTENEQLQNYFSGGLPPLKPDEALCEFVYTHPDFRGLGLMGWITKNLWQIAKQKGINRISVLVHGTNEVSLNMTPKIGFIPIYKKTVERRFFTKRVTFEKIQSPEPVGQEINPTYNEDSR